MNHMLTLFVVLCCRWEPLLGIIASGLVPLLQDRLTAGLVELAMHVLSTVSVCDFVTAVLQVIVGVGLLAPACAEFSGAHFHAPMPVPVIDWHTAEHCRHKLFPIAGVSCIVLRTHNAQCPALLSLTPLRPALPCTQPSAVATQHANVLLESIYNKSLSVRLGLLSPDHQSLLLVLPTQLGAKAGSKDASGKDAQLHSITP